MRANDGVRGLCTVTSVDGMTADVYPFDGAFLIRVAPAPSTKPPGTIEWE